MGPLTLPHQPMDPRAAAVIGQKDSLDKSVWSGAWTRTIKDMHAQNIGQTWTIHTEILTLHLFVCSLK